MLPLAAAMAATAAAVTMIVVPVGAKPADVPVGADVDSAALISPEVPVEVKSPSGQLAPGTRRVAVFGDSVAWTMMRYLPPTPGLSFTNYTTIGCGIARGGPYGTSARRSIRSPNATRGRSGGRSGSAMTGPTSCC